MRAAHLVILPILIPLMGATVGLLLWRRRRWQAIAAAMALLLSLLSAGLLLVSVWRQGPLVFQLGGWPAPFGISLVGDLTAPWAVATAACPIPCSIPFS
jgi:multicomponent Na+:H+ antiporter subunit D